MTSSDLPPGTGSGDPESPQGAPRTRGCDRLLTVEDLAEMLGLTTRAARLVLERGELPGFMVGRRWFIRPEALELAFRKKEAEHARDREKAARLIRGLRSSRSSGSWPDVAAEGANG